ncbi:unnamed protein product [Cylicocyclus nassatus]|uniref:G-protein coupled receptors family 1 profile domain-containing protein n=1 Tax=Cylicocyclus nassatus TaxID=53992 RepID=A0AA36H5E9_CYLNA|nr:unnamed protein product [Cylicocyclus nassatus]
MSSNMTLELVPRSALLVAIAFSLVGCIGNGLIILATILSPTLRSRCNLLICLLAIADFIICAYLIQIRVQMLHNWYFLTNKECFLHSFHGLFALNVQAAVGLVIGLDRLFAVALPTRYSRLPGFLYAMMVAAVLSYASLFTMFGYWDSSMEVIPVCFPPFAYNNTSRAVWFCSNVVIAFLVIAVYGLAHLKCRTLCAKNTHARSILRIKHLLLSLSIVMGIYTATWFVTMIVSLITLFLPITPRISQGINDQLGWLVIINSSNNFFVYFCRAPEYRKVFVDIGCLFKSNQKPPAHINISLRNITF